MAGLVPMARRLAGSRSWLARSRFWLTRSRSRLMAAVGLASLVVVGLAFWLFPASDVVDPNDVVVVDLADHDPHAVAPIPPAGSSEEDGDATGAAGSEERVALLPAPQPALVEDGAFGPLPVIGPDGNEPWQVYARPHDSGDTRPRIAIIITEIGLDSATSEAAVGRLPGPVTLAIDPYATTAEDWAARAREGGHEILLSLPMESSEFPFRDPGPMALLTGTGAADNMERLHLALSRCTGYVGVLSQFAQRFEQNADSLRPVLRDLAGRGLIYVDGIHQDDPLVWELADEMTLPHVQADAWLDDAPAAGGIDRVLSELETIARERAVAVGVGRAYPLTIERVGRWARSLDDKGIALIPVSAAADRQFRP